MAEIEIRDTVEEDFNDIIKLNDAAVLQTSPMDLNSLRLLDEMACYHRVAIFERSIVAFLLAIRSGAPYQNDNYKWFASRMQDFLYIDRIIVDARGAGLKIGSKLYNDVFAYARSLGIQTITCEYNIQPLNAASRAFHDKYGFKEIGKQWVANATKQVTLQTAETMPIKENYHH